MQSTTAIVKCPICGKHYYVYGHYVGDQSACRRCRAEAQKDAQGDPRKK